jgi:hypothetical protein
MSNVITKEWMDAHDAVVQGKLQPLADAAVVKTLQSAPTEATLTYMIGTQTYNYQIGDEVRVADANAETGYVYYKLFDIDNNTAVWDKTGGSGESVYPSIRVTLQALVDDEISQTSDLNGVTVSVQNITDNTAPITMPWAGSELVFSNLEPLKEYLVSVAAIENYVTPSSYAVPVMGFGQTVSHTFQYIYKTEEAVTGYIIDQSDPDALAADYIVKDIPAMNSTDEDDVIHRIWSNTKLFAAATSLSNSKLQVRELSRDNKSQWADGTAVANNTTYDKFMKLPEFWWHCEEVAANTDRWKIDFTMDNPNDESWNHWDGNTFIGVYEAYNSGNLVYSRTGQTPTGNVTWTNFKAYAAARGAGYSLVTYEAHQIMALLGYGWLGTTDDQSIVGYGGNEYTKVTGKCDAKGIHDTSAAVDGGNTAGGGSNISINFWGLENWWGNMAEWVDNIQTANSSGLVNILTPGSSTVNRTVQTTTGNGCMTKTTMGDKGDMIPKAYVSDSTYSKGYASYGYVLASAGCVARRSRSDSSANGGLGYLDVYHDASVSIASVGSRLLYHGDWEETNSLT